jgi:hypothetical protein
MFAATQSVETLQQEPQPLAAQEQGHEPLGRGLPAALDERSPRESAKQ